MSCPFCVNYVLSLGLWRVTFGSGRARLAECSCTSHPKFEILYTLLALSWRLCALARGIRVYRLARRSLGEGGCPSVVKISVSGTRPICGKKQPFDPIKLN
jgi:hypothetical protein